MTEPSQTRNVAFSTLFNMLPDLPVLQEIADKMQNEKDAQVSSYVISVLQSFANTTFEPAALLSRNASIALENAPMYRTGLQHSFVKFGGKYSAQYKMGLSASLSSIGSMDSYESNVFRLDSVIYGLYSQLFEVGAGHGSSLN
ncbi:uncharacterized protein LOC106012169 [Aplysia californica]|uniref:Uncharacterized protein LOC106012169 n=1 Tax=Aplysia californica TaxID=6500 RepID=A0ABM1A2T7_APLCA|nr:uncharacterized protein LOC106012169 [Aplysia californica]